MKELNRDERTALICFVVGVVLFLVEAPILGGICIIAGVISLLG